MKTNSNVMIGQGAQTMWTNPERELTEIRKKDLSTDNTLSSLRELHHRLDPKAPLPMARRSTPSGKLEIPFPVPSNGKVGAPANEDGVGTVAGLLPLFAFGVPFANLTGWLRDLFSYLDFREHPITASAALLLFILAFTFFFRRRSRLNAEKSTLRVVQQLIASMEALSESQSPLDPAPPEDHRSGKAAFADVVLITVHGVNSLNEGFARLETDLIARLPGLTIEYVKYDNATIRKVSPESRANAYWAVYNQLMATVHQFGPSKRYFLLAHSFGTIATIYALQAVVKDLKLQGIIWEGCALTRSQNWNWIHTIYGRANGTLPQLNVIRPFDCVVPFARFVGGGDAGSKGFIPMGSNTNLPRQTHKHGGHGGYVQDADVIAAVIQGTAIKAVSFADWKKELGGAKRLLLWVRNRF